METKKEITAQDIAKAFSGIVEDKMKNIVEDMIFPKIDASAKEVVEELKKEILFLKKSLIAISMTTIDSIKTISSQALDKEQKEKLDKTMDTYSQFLQQLEKENNEEKVIKGIEVVNEISKLLKDINKEIGKRLDDVEQMVIRESNYIDNRLERKKKELNIETTRIVGESAYIIERRLDKIMETLQYMKKFVIKTNIEAESINEKVGFLYETKNREMYSP